MAEHERSFELFGSEVRLLIGEPVREGLPEPAVAAMQIEGFLSVVHRGLSRFDPASALCALNADRHESCAVSPLLVALVESALWAAERSEGLVDPTLIGELERVGYAESRVGAAPVPLAEAIAWAPPRRPARPDGLGAWRTISVDAARGVVRRPPAVRLDSGGTGKGLAADLASARLRGYETHVVDAGGDLRIGGERPQPRRVEVAHPIGAEPAYAFEVAEGAVATSGIATRVWRTEDGFAHHLLDPSTGQPAWTGIVQATALGRTALEAETLAKSALLSGPDGAARFLAEHGGVVILDDGEAVPFGAPVKRAAARSIA